MWSWLEQTPPFVFVSRHETLFGVLAVVSVAMFIASLVLAPLLLIGIPADYFMRDHKQRKQKRTVLGWSVLIAKNLLGGVLLLAGIAMLLLPGQGIIAILAGISLMNFPGKQSLELKIISRPTVLRSVNWLRGKAGRLPIEISD